MTSSIDLLIPDLGDFENIEVIEVLVSVGDSVSQEDGLIVVETDKASMDIPAPQDGVVGSLTVGVGDTVSTGDVIGTLSVVDAARPETAEPIGGETTVVASEADMPKTRIGKQTLVVPNLGDFDAVEVIEVHISAGDEVELEGPLVTLETDKAAMDVPASHQGRFRAERK